MYTPSKEELDDMLKIIDSGADDKRTYKPVRLEVGPGRDCISVPSQDLKNRRVFERNKGGEWEEVPFIGGTSNFE